MHVLDSRKLKLCFTGSQTPFKAREGQYQQRTTHGVLTAHFALEIILSQNPARILTLRAIQSQRLRNPFDRRGPNPGSFLPVGF
jgi:hypothetical protein